MLDTHTLITQLSSLAACHRLDSEVDDLDEIVESNPPGGFRWRNMLSSSESEVPDFKIWSAVCRSPWPARGKFEEEKMKWVGSVGLQDLFESLKMNIDQWVVFWGWGSLEIKPRKRLRDPS